MSIPNIRSNGGYSHIHSFGSMPNDTVAVDAYRAILANLDRTGTRYVVVSRETYRDDDNDGIDLEPVEPIRESETEIYVNVSPVFISDMFQQLGSFYFNGGDRARYYSDSVEYYEVCTCHHGSQHAVTESYCIDVVNVSPLVLDVIERSAGI